MGAYPVGAVGQYQALARRGAWGEDDERPNEDAERVWDLVGVVTPAVRATGPKGVPVTLSQRRPGGRPPSP